MKKPRNKKYQPKYVSINPMSTFLGGMSGEHADHLVKLNLLNHGALASIVRGSGTRDDWDRLVGAINMANILCECGKRIVKTGRVLFTGDELRAVNAGMAAHDAQLENVRAIDIDQAAAEVIRRVRHGINTTNVRAELAKAAQI